MEFDLKNPPIIEKRKLVASGASIVLSLPRKWIEENGLKIGDEVIVVANGDLQLMKNNQENVERINDKISTMREHFSQNNQMETKPIKPKGT